MNTALNRTSVALLTNKSGGSVAQGDVVVVDSANAAAFTTTTTSGYVNGLIGVVLEPNGIASNATGTVALSGYVPIVNLSAAASLGDVFKTHSVAKQAVRHAAPVVAGDFGQVLGTGTTPAAILGELPAQGGGGGTTGFVQLSSQVLSGTAASVTFSSISQSYRHLRLIRSCRSDAAVISTALNMQFNGDTTANYDFTEFYDSGAATGQAVTTGGTALGIGYAMGASATAGVFAAGTVDIIDYTGVLSQKAVLSESVRKDSTSSIYVLHDFGTWRTSNAAITSIVITPGSGLLIAGSVFTLYGLL